MNNRPINGQKIHVEVGKSKGSKPTGDRGGGGGGGRGGGRYKDINILFPFL